MNPPSSNPFADEPLPQTGARLTSANPLNPYAAPATVGESNTVPPPGVGLWRDGPYLVVHQDARYPKRCLLTGVETDERYRQNVRWFYPIDFATRTLRVEYGLLPSIKERVRWQRIGGFVMGSLAAVIVLGTMQSAEFNPALRLTVFWTCVAIAVIGFHFGINGGRFLVFHKVKNSYLWLRGAKPVFLDTLPEWTGLGS